MADLFPEDPQLQRFASRYRIHGFDPTVIRPIISPAVQARPKALPTIEKPPSIQDSPRPPPLPMTNSPKRPLEDDFDPVEPPRKIARGGSPLKGRAGQILETQKRREGRESTNPGMPSSTPTPSLPRDVIFLLSILPPAHTYNVTRFSPQRMVDLLRNTDLTRNNSHPGSAPGQPNGTSFSLPVFS
jgi:cleavage stimulation factor subunit 3